MCINAKKGKEFLLFLRDNPLTYPVALFHIFMSMTEVRDGSADSFNLCDSSVSLIFKCLQRRRCQLWVTLASALIICLLVCLFVCFRSSPLFRDLFITITLAKTVHVNLRLRPPLTFYQTWIILKLDYRT